MARKAASKEHLKIKLRERRITFTMEPTASMLTNDPFRYSATWFVWPYFFVA